MVPGFTGDEVMRIFGAESPDALLRRVESVTEGKDGWCRAFALSVLLKMMAVLMDPSLQDDC